MNGSTLLPLLLIGPIFLGMISMLLYQFSGQALFATIGKICVVFALAVIGFAVAAHLRAMRRRRSLPKAGE